MANREKGERAIDINGASYTLVLDIDAMCRLEDLFSTADKEVTFGEVMARAEKGSIRHIRALWWACFSRHQPEMTLEATSRLIADVGGLVGLQAKLLEVAKAASTPDPRDVEDAGVKPKRPRAAQVNGTGGTGEISTSKPGASA